MTHSSTLVVNGNTYFHHYKKVEVPPQMDLLAWLSQSKRLPKFYWKNRDGTLEVAAVGSLLTLSQPPLFGNANDSPARFWGGHAFFPEIKTKDKVWSGFPTTVFFLPHIEIIRENHTTKALLQSLGGPIIEEIDLFPGQFSASPTSVKFVEYSPSFHDWAAFIEQILKKIESSHFSKVVTARRSTHKGKVDPFALLSRLQAQNSTYFAFQVDASKTFIGATPERLYLREGRTLFSEAVAGTRKRGTSSEEDLALENELLESEKEQREFSFVMASIKDGLLPLCTTLSHDKKWSILKTLTVQHLYSKFQGELKPSITDPNLLKALHPSAALGGFPKISALEHIALYEPFERGWYASPIGFASQEKSEFVVGIRSALVENDNLHLFAGTGIVEGSSPEKEWEELYHKTLLWKKVIA